MGIGSPWRLEQAPDAGPILPVKSLACILRQCTAAGIAAARIDK